MKRRRLLILAGVLTGLALLILVALMVRPRLEREVRRRLLAGLAGVSGCAVSLGDLEIRLLPPAIRLSDVALKCGGTSAIQVPEVQARIGVSALLRGRLQLTRLEVVAPDIRLQSTSLPQAPATAGTPAPAAAGIRIGKANIRGGRLLVEAADGTQISAVFDLRAENLYRDGRTAARLRLSDGKLPGWGLDAVSAEAGLTLQGGWLELEAARIRAHGAGQATLSGRIEVGAEAAERQIQLQGSIEIEAAALSRHLPGGTLLAGPVAWQGEVKGHGDAWTVTGKLTAAGVEVAAINIRDIVAAELMLQGRGLTPAAVAAGKLQADVLGGRVSGRLGGSGEPWAMKGELGLHKGSLAEVISSLPWPAGWPIPAGPVEARLEGMLAFADPWAGPASWSVQLGGSPQPWSPAGLIRGSLQQGGLSMEEGSLHLDGLRAGFQGRLDRNLLLDGEGSLAAEDLGAMLGRLGGGLAGLQAANAWHPGGAMTWAGRITGPAGAPQLAGAVEGRGLVVGDLELGRLHGQVTWNGDRLQLNEAILEGPLGKIEAAGEIGMAGGGSLAFQVARLDLAAVSVAAGHPELLSGTAAGNGTVVMAEGSWRVEAELGGGSLEILHHLPVDDWQLKAAADAAGLRLAALELHRGGGQVTVSGGLPWEVPMPGAALDFTMDDYPIASLAAAAMGGELSARARLGGTLSAPQWLAGGPLRVIGLSWGEWGPFTLHGDLQGDTHELHATLQEAADSFSLSARLELPPASGFILELQARPQMIPLPETPSGEALELYLGGVRAVVSGETGDLDSIVSLIHLESVELHSGEARLSTQEELRLEGRAGSFQAGPVSVVAGGQTMTASGWILLGEPPRYGFELHGRTDLRAVQPFSGAQRLAGSAEVDIRITGAGPAVQVSGDLVVSGGHLKLAQFPHALEQFSARARLDGQRLRLEQLTGLVAGGRVDASGEIDLSGGQPGEFKLQSTGERVSVQFGDGLSAVGDFDLQLAGRPGDTEVTGEVRLLRGRYTQRWNVERSLLTATRPVNVPPPPGPLDHVRLGVHIDAPGQLWMDNDFARLELRADLMVRGTAARPRLEGAVEMQQPGGLTFQKVRYTVTGASLQLTPSYPNDPDLDIVAQTSMGDYTVNLAVSGRLSDMRLELSSEPALAQEEIVALLLSGGRWRRGNDREVSPEILASYVGEALGPVGQAISKISGIDEARIDPVFVEGQSDPTARLTLVERITRDLSVAWSTTLGNSQNDTAELRYRVLPHLELRLAHEENGVNATEARYVRSFFTGRRAVAQLSGDDRRRLTALHLEGLPAGAAEEEIRRALGLKVGEVASEGDLILAAAQARAALAHAGYPLARVELAFMDALAVEGGVTCTMVAGERVNLEVEIKGKQQTAALRQAVLERWDEAAAVEDLEVDAELAAQDYHRGRGEWHAVVVVEQVRDAAALTVRVQVDPGPVVRVANVALEGVESLEHDEVLEVLGTATRDLLRRPLLTPGLLAVDRDTLRRLYFGAGYLEALVGEPRVEFPKRQDRARVTLAVVEGRRLPLTGIEFRGLAVVGEEEVRQALEVHPTPYPEPVELERLVNELRTFYDRRGYPDIEASWSLERNASAGVGAVIEVREGAQIMVGEVRISGNTLTRDRVIRRELTFDSGDPFRHSALFASRQRLRQLNLFRSVTIRGAAEDHHGVRAILVEVDEKNDLDLAVGAGFDDEEGPRFSMSMGYLNGLGLGGLSSAQVRVGGDLSLAQVRTAWRRVGGTRNDLLGFVGLRDEDRDGFIERRVSLTGQVSRPWNQDTSLQFRYRLEDIELRNIEVSPESIVLNSGLLASLGGSLIRATLDDPKLPTQGAVRTVDLSVYSALLGSDADFVKLFVQQRRFWPFSRYRLVYHGSLRLGFAWTLGGTPQVPISERFFAGGLSSVRGYGQDLLGPLDAVALKPAGGQALVVLNQELRIPLFSRFSAHLFLDAGQIYRRVEDMDLEFKYSAGPGFSIATPAGALRFYYARKLNGEPGEERSRFHFNFGAIF